jgi:hypothetical protein
MANYDRITQQFGKFFNQEELAVALNKKADIKQVQTALGEKASYVDFEHCLKVID